MFPSQLRIAVNANRLILAVAKWTTLKRTKQGTNERTDSAGSSSLLGGWPFCQPYLPRQSTIPRAVVPLYVQCRPDAIKWASHYHQVAFSLAVYLRNDLSLSLCLSVSLSLCLVALPSGRNVPGARTRPISFTVCLRSSWLCVPRRARGGRASLCS